MSEQFPGGLITKTPVTPSGPYASSTASGVWTLEEAYHWKGDGLWPTAGNIPNYYTLFGIQSDAGYDNGTVTTDSSSNTYLGTYLSEVGTAYSSKDIVWVSKWGAGGSSPVWQRSAQDTGLSYARIHAIAVDSTADVIALLNTYTASSYFSTLLKWDTDGVFQWGRKYGSTARHATAVSLGVDSSDNIYLLTKGTSAGYGSVGKWSSAGTSTLEYKFTGYGTTLDVAFCDLTVDSSDYVLIGASAADSSGSGADVGNLGRITSAGVLDWSIQITQLQSGVKAVATDSSDNVYTSGESTSTFVPYISKFNSSGTRQWARKIEGSASGTVWSSGYPDSMAVDSSDNLYVQGHADVNNTGSGGVNNQALVVFKYNSSGVLQWSRYIQANQSLNSSYWSISIEGTNYVLSCKANAQNSSSTQSSIFFNLPTDGSKTGTYTNTGYTPSFVIYYGVLDVAESADTTSAVSTYSWTVSSEGLTEAATGMTSATGTLTWDNETL